MNLLVPFLSFLLLSPLVIASSPPLPCSWTGPINSESNHTATWDLSPLYFDPSGPNIHSGNDHMGQQYFVNFCGPVNSESLSPNCNGSGSCQQSGSTFSSFGRYTTGAFSVYTPHGNYTEGVVYSYQNGDMCVGAGVARSVKIHVDCDRDYDGEIYQVAEASICAYSVYFRSKYGCSDYSSDQHTTEEQRRALESLYESTNGKNWRNSYKWLQGDPCKDSWYGVKCDAERNIASLDLGGNNLVGSIPKSIGDLKMLLQLDLQNNQLSGTIPESIGSMRFIKYLLLANNNLSGTIGNFISAPALDILNLSSNNLSGTIGELPQELQFASRISLANNSFVGTIPNFANMKRLYSLDLSSNYLSGTIGEFPEFIAKIDLSSNKLYGPLRSIASYEELKYISFSNNQFTGTIPDWSNNTFTKDSKIYLENNLLESPFPDWLSTRPDVDVIDMRYNLFSCPLPEWCSESGTGECTPCL